MRYRLALLVLTQISIAGCHISINGGVFGIPGSGTIESEARSVGDFQAIHWGGSGRLVISRGDTTSLNVTCDDNLLEHIETSVDGETLRIKTIENIRPTDVMFVEITCPELSQVHLSGSGSIELIDQQSPSLDIRLSGSGSVKGSGSVDKLSAKLSGSGGLSLDEIHAKKAEVTISGSGSAKVHATEEFKGRISGSGGITCYGQPDTVDEHVSGSGRIKFAD